MNAAPNAPRHAATAHDQAAGLRRLFAPSTVRLLTVLSDGAAGGHTAWMVRLAQALAGTGQRTVVIDGARAQLAAALGLRARYDLWHGITGQCTFAEVQLDAAPSLAIVPAARAMARAAEANMALDELLAPLLLPAVDQVLLLLPPAQARLLPAGEVLVPVTATRTAVAGALGAIGRAAEQAGNLAFRLLFLAMDQDAAATLCSRMTASIGVRSRALVRIGAVAPVARDLAQVVAAASSWQLPVLRRPQRTEVMEK